MKNAMPTPPKWADQFLVWFVSEDLIEEIQGDLHEAYYARAAKYGRTAANRQFIADVFQFFKPYAFEKYSRAKQFLPMFDNYFKIALRNILHRKGFTAINLLGLTFGISAVMLIGIYLQNELSYDHATPGHDRIHRVMNKYRDQTYTCMAFNGYNETSADSQLMLVNLLDSYDEVETACHFVPTHSPIGGFGQYFLEMDGKRFTVEKALYTNTGAAFQAVFPQRFLAGTPETAFSGFKKIILTETLAERIFGSNWANQDIVGKDITLRGEGFQLGGVVADVPGNVHYSFDFILHQDRIPGWAGYTYFKLKPNQAAAPVLAKLNTDVGKYHPNFVKDELWKGFISVPLTDIHFTNGNLYELKPTANKAYLTTFGIVGLVILLIILTNYTNLSIAMYADRQKELGMRKALGAQSHDISLQLLVEAVLLSLLCAPFVLFLLQYLLPPFSELMGIELGKNILFNGLALLSLLALLLLTGMLSGLYPALAYGSRSMLRLFGKTSTTTANGYFNFRNTLTAVQFTMVVGLLSITYFIYQQMEFVNNMDLGYQKEGVVYFNIDGIEKYRQLEKKLLELPEVEAVGANGVPGPMMLNQLTYKMKDTETTLSDGTEQYFGLGTVKALGLDCEPCAQLAGSKERIFVINRTAAEKLAKVKGVAPDELVGETLVMEPEWENEEFGYGVHHTIDGIIDDYKYFSLKYADQPLLITIAAEPAWAYEMLVRLNTDNWFAAASKIKTAYEAVETERPLEILFLEDRLYRLYADERRSSVLLGGLSLVAIVLALMGLAGIVSYMAFSRQKEIGIRKILGASTGNILLTFNREYLLLMVVSTAVAMPVALWLSSKWLEGFAFRIEPQFWVVLMAGLLALTLVAAVVTLRTRRAAAKHPVETLRAE